MLDSLGFRPAERRGLIPRDRRPARRARLHLPAICAIEWAIGPLDLPVSDASAAPIGRYFREYRVPGNVVPVVASRDNSVWLLDYRGAIERLTLGGRLTVYPTPGEPEDIALGADGAIWFIEFDSKRLRRLDPSGRVRSFDTGASYQLTAIAAASDGSVWFAAADEIGRRTADGRVRLYPPPPPSSATDFHYIRRIATGPGGHVWLGDWMGRWLGLAGMDGTISWIPLPFPGADVATDRGGNAWVTEHGGGIARVSPDGTVVNYTAGISASPRRSRSPPTATCGSPTRTTPTSGASTRPAPWPSSGCRPHLCPRSAASRQARTAMSGSPTAATARSIEFCPRGSGHPRA
jgi:virginiamycin B lyase